MSEVLSGLRVGGGKDEGPTIHLGLHRHDADGQVITGAAASRISPGRQPVLLLHGASATHKTFTFPDGGLAKCLAENGFDPWSLDWRGSGLVVDEEKNTESLSNDKDARTYNFNLAAQVDVKEAIATIGRQYPGVKVSALGFCMGGGILAEAIALNAISAADVDCVVLMTLGLFYETPIDGRMKSEDRILEQLVKAEVAAATAGGKPQRVVAIDPRVETTKATERSAWASRLNEMYRNWPSPLKSHARRTPEEVDESSLSATEIQRLRQLETLALERDGIHDMCNRLSFMYGMPYHHGNLVDLLHGNDDGSVKAALLDQFGAIPLHMYIHGARNIRQGHATHYQRRKAPGKPPERADSEFVSEEARQRFRDLTKVTLMTGALNRLWHRNSIDLMYEWLIRGAAEHLPKFKKHILPDYGHQDLLWGRKSAREVYPTILAGLRA